MKHPSSRPPARGRHPGRLRRLLGAGALVVAASLGLGQLPALAAQTTADSGGAAPAAYDASAAQQQRQDECLLSTVLRLGGPSMKQVAAQGLDGDPAALHAAAAADYWDTTPLSTAYQQDHTAQSAKLDELSGRHTVWEQPLSGLVTPHSGFASDADFHWAPNPDFFSTVGLTPWVAQQFWTTEDAVYADQTPLAGKASADAATTLANALYPEPTNGNDPNFEREYNEWRAWQDMTFMHGLFADDTRLLLEDGGFPRTAPDPGTVEFRVAVEDLKSRFASCEWRNPEDPDGVLGQEVQTAATEWQAEISAQQPERDALLAANAKATAALQTAAQAFGEALGQSWIADHLARWEAYWQPGGQGSAGNGSIKFQLKSGTTLCLDDPKSSTTNGGPIQATTCTTSNSMEWRPASGTVLDGPLVNVASGKCLYATGGKVQQYTCNNTAAEHWQYTTTGGVTRLYNVGTKQCVNFASATGGLAATAVTCSTAAAQQFVATQNNAGTGTGTDSLDYMDAAKQFTQAKSGLTAAQSAAKAQLAVVQQQLTIAQAQATATTTAEQQAYAAADAIGAPRGRGLLSAQQEAQVTMASAAAVQAMESATQTAYDATTAAATDTQALQAKAQTLGLASKAAFRTAAAQEADTQAKAAAAGAALQAKNAAAAKAKAQQALATAQQAEATAKSAADTAHAKLLAAQAEQQKAAADKQEAAADEATAARDQATAEQDDQAAQAALAAAQASGATAAEKRQAAEAADSAASQARQQATSAARTRDAAAAKAQAADAYADAHASQSDAQDARTAANQADQEAATATTDADNASAAAGQATAAAEAADAAATRAEAAASRAQSDADAASAAKATADAAVRTDEAAVATAVQAAAQASTDAATAKQDAADAAADATTARTNANAAVTDAQAAQASAATTAGYAYTTAQAATAAADAAAQVAKPANDAIQLGSPYVDSDSSAGLAVLTAQASKTVADQQQAMAQAKSAQAAQAAADAQALADAATGDAKNAQVAAADAAAQAAAAQASAQQAVADAAAAEKAAAEAVATQAQTIAYDTQATADAAAAQAAAQAAAGDATDARASANAAEADASAAQSAAADAQAAAATARAVAAQADKDATAAEAAAKDAESQAAAAQQAATEAEKQAEQQATATDMLATGGVFYRAQVQPTEIDPNGDCVGTNGCDISLTFHYTGDVSFYLLSDCVADSPTSCTGTYQYLGHQPFTTSETKTVHIDGVKLTEEIDEALLKGAVSDFTGCIDKHQLSSCAWAAAMSIPPDRILKLASLARDTLDAIRGAADVDKAIEDAKVVDGLGDDQGVENIEGLAAKALVQTEGEDAARATLNQRLAELLRRFSLGVDPAKGQIFNVGEMQTALRVEAERGVQLARDSSGDLEWYDSAGRGYDAVGNSPAQYLDVQAFTRSITSHLLKTERTGRAISFVPVDVSTYTADQISQIKQFVSGLSTADQARVFLVGAGG